MYDDYFDKISDAEHWKKIQRRAQLIENIKFLVLEMQELDKKIHDALEWISNSKNLSDFFLIANEQDIFKTDYHEVVRKDIEAYEQQREIVFKDYLEVCKELGEIK